MSQGSLRPGVIIDDRFTLKRRLGAGSTGAVWLAGDGAEREVALKILHPKMSHDRMLVAQFDREAKVLTQLDHPNIAGAIAFNSEGQFVYLAMEFLDGRTLNEAMGDRTRRQTFFEGDELVSLFGQLCNAVSYAHSKWIVHRDLKPQNVMVLKGSRPLLKVLDFGIAKLLEGSIFDATTFGRQLGSLFYMSPEQTRGEPADVRSDVFALGTMFFELVTLHRAWAWDNNDRPVPAFGAPLSQGEANALPSVFMRISGPKRPRPRQVRPELPPIFDQIVERAVAAKPDERYQSVAELAQEALAALARGAR